MWTSWIMTDLLISLLVVPHVLSHNHGMLGSFSITFMSKVLKHGADESGKCVCSSSV